MPRNDLLPNVSRFGQLIDFDSTTPPVQATLERTESALQLAITWPSPHSDYARWFGIDQHGMSRNSTRVPTRLLFYDNEGALLLIGCRYDGYRANIGGFGTGRIRVMAAVAVNPGRAANFDTLHGLRTKITGLRGWLGVSSWEITHLPTRSSRLDGQNADMIDVGACEDFSVTFRPFYIVNQTDDGDRIILDDQVWCQTMSTDTTGWRDHLRVHRTIRDLLVVSRWHDESCRASSVYRQDDPVITLDGTEHPAIWRTVVVAGEDTEPPTRYVPHLIPFEEIKEAGIQQWFRLSAEASRALDPVITSITLHQTPPLTLLAHTGPGIEALGGLLLKRDGKPKAEYDNAGLRDRVDRIASEIGDCVPFDAQEWAADFTRAYNSIKHVNRTMPAPHAIINAWQDSVQVVRAWVASELGVTPEHVRDRLTNGPLSGRYRPAAAD